MGMSSGGGRGGMKSDINVTPLVDVVLVLLIIFMVVTPMMQRGKDVELPQAKHIEEEDGPDPLILSVTPDRKLFVESEAYPDERALQAKLKAELTQVPRRRLLLKVDQSLTYADVMKVMQLAKDSGAERVSLAVVKPENEANSGAPFPLTP
ncbi:biopolymer transporter ExbD [Myxococcus sp. CA039A]|uniref:ExbD/TolR family protein n=1 Tax=Myxococcus sp. CA039A TaxID=2741737 RepID=UPI00157B02D1|nr:biopolymer transporter ExbD [Myxococcus sp. CA039A]NTX58477.1 biopolymer transporter ExbD [Myxococcus sp. CA039A]